MKNWKTMSIVTLLLTLAVAIPPAQAKKPINVQCGDVLGPGRVYRLKKDLNCNVTPAITLQRGTTLNLKGHTIACDINLVPSQVGVLMTGKHAKLMNGNIGRCNVGVDIQGEGKHIVKRVSADAYVGFAVESDNNLLSRNTATGGDGGFEVGGNNNKLIRNIAIDNPGNGFFIYSGSRHRLISNKAIYNGAQGFNIQSDESLFINNRSISNRSDPTNVNVGTGFEVVGTGNRLIYNFSYDNTADGFRILGNDTKLVINEATDNERSGIFVTGTDNVIKYNTSLDNGDGEDYFDLQDDDPNCENNVWKRNKFNTRSPDCIN